MVCSDHRMSSLLVTGVALGLVSFCLLILLAKILFGLNLFIYAIIKLLLIFSQGFGIQNLRFSLNMFNLLI